MVMAKYFYFVDIFLHFIKTDLISEILTFFLKPLFEFFVLFIFPETVLPTNRDRHHVKLTHWLLDCNVGCSLYKRSDANCILGSHSEEISLSRGEVVSHGILSASGVGERGPGLAITIPLLNDIVANGRAAVILREKPIELTGVNCQVLSS